MNEEYYSSDVSQHILNSRNQFIETRSKQLIGFQGKFIDEAVKYLFLVNTGGAVAIWDTWVATVLNLMFGVLLVHSSSLSSGLFVLV